MKTEEKGGEVGYKIRATKFMGRYDYPDGSGSSYTYEITFNKSLEHTGRFIGIEEGLNAYVEREKKQDVKDAVSTLWYRIKRMFSFA